MKKDRKISDSIIEWLLAISRHSGEVIVDNESLLENFATEDAEDKLGINSKCFQWLYKIVRRIRFCKIRQRRWLLSRKIYKRINRTLFHKKSFRFVTMIATVFFILVFTVHFAIDFINDVILFDTEINVNEQGALNPKKALNCEHAMYLFNPSEVWANTGIRLNKGDKYRIAISGGANTTIYESISAAKNNIKPLYDGARFDFDIEPKGEKNIQYCLSKGAQHIGSDGKMHYFNFGTIMYVIQPEGANIKYNPLSVPAKELRSWDPGNLSSPHDGDREFHKANSSGFLYLAVNDIVFGEINVSDAFDKNDYFVKVIKEFWRRTHERIKGKIIEIENGVTSHSDSNAFSRDTSWHHLREFICVGKYALKRAEWFAITNLYHYLDKCETPLLYTKAIDNIKEYVKDDFAYFIDKNKQSGEMLNSEKLQQNLISRLNEDHKYFYNDNFGQILVSVEIQRNEPGAFFNPMMAYRDFETRVAELPKANVNASCVIKVLTYIWAVIVFLWYLFVFFCHMILLYAIGAFQLWLAIVLLFIFVGFLQHLIFGGKNRNKSRINKPAETPETT